jgi:hypothetical protein
MPRDAPIRDNQPAAGISVDSDRARLLHLLASVDTDPLTIADLRERGIRMPGQAIYELELDGYPVERVHYRGRTRGCSIIGYRLGEPSPHIGADHSDTRRVR